ncbi:GNAT family N-acetyltransferase [Bremerella cremea]|uniref:GNAT family N-acetyltransferase n=1 Tax=Bremerella cremea TaxID=1031537 RepID=UPI0031EFC1B5
MPSEIILRVPFFSDLANLAMTLRREVFVVEQNVPDSEEYDIHDPTGDHYVVVREGCVVATTRVLRYEEESRLSRFAVRRSLRGSGVGGRLCDFVMKDLAAQGRTKVFLHAQVDKIGFYAKYGFKPYGEEYLECDILHRNMRNWEPA